MAPQHASIPPLRPTTRFKLISLGNSGVGKSCLIKRYCEEKFVAKNVPTIGIDFGVKQVPVNGEPVRINFFDFAGGSEYSAVRAEFFRDAMGVMLVFDVADRRSFEALESWLKEGDACGLKNPVVVVVCASKVDSKKRAVSEAEARKWANAHNAAYFETSAKEGTGVQPMFESLFHQMAQICR